ncbi:MAG: hypothetical protein ACJ8DI_03570 [Ktedonobacteraceae bacterium]
MKAELISWICLKLHACLPSRNSSSIHLFTKSGHEPDDLYHTFLKVEPAPAGADNLRPQFETCIGRVESRGLLIRRLSFGNFVLLQPELLDAYASALVNAVKD